MPHGYKCNVTCEPPCLKLNLEQQSARTLCIRLNASTTSMDSPSISGRGGLAPIGKEGGGGPFILLVNSNIKFNAILR